MVLLMAGPAANAASVMVIGKVLGRRTLAVYIVSIVLGAVAFGLGVDYLLPREWFTEPIRAIHAGEHAHMSWFNVACSVVLVGLLVNAMILRYRHKGRTPARADTTTASRRARRGVVVVPMRLPTLWNIGSVLRVCTATSARPTWSECCWALRVLRA